MAPVMARSLSRCSPRRMTAQLELTLVNQKSEIAKLHDRLEGFLGGQDVPLRSIHDLQLALEEHLTNVISYGYNDDKAHQIRIRVCLNGSELKVAVEDDAVPFNPLDHPTPDFSMPIEERSVGGLGIHMMRKSLDAMEYHRADSKNILVMTKRI